MNTIRHYPDGLIGDNYLDGQMWSGSLWQIWNLLGQITTDKLVVKSHTLIAGDKSQARFGEGADAIIAADGDLNSGSNIATISNIFRQRGIFDAYDIDNTSATATIIPTDDSPQTLNFHSISDVDWVEFNATAGVRYYVSTRNLGDNANTVLELYGMNGSTLLASNDDCIPLGLTSCLAWIAPNAGMYFVRVRPFDTAWTGPYSTYDLGIRVLPPLSPSKLFMPVILRGY